MKFHLNKHGTPAPCHASMKACPLGESTRHFEDAEAARNYAFEQALETDRIPVASASPTDDLMAFLESSPADLALSLLNREDEQGLLARLKHHDMDLYREYRDVLALEVPWPKRFDYYTPEERRTLFEHVCTETADQEDWVGDGASEPAYLLHYEEAIDPEDLLDWVSSFEDEAMELTLADFDQDLVRTINDRDPHLLPDDARQALELIQDDWITAMRRDGEDGAEQSLYAYYKQKHPQEPDNVHGFIEFFTPWHQRDYPDEVRRLVEGWDQSLGGGESS